MNEYLLLFRNDPNQDTQTTCSEHTVMQQWQSWIKGIADNGNFGGTNRLHAEGKTLKPGMVTDGPYMEAREMIGGYVMIKANSMEEAVAIAEKCPNLIYGGNVEVRSVINIDGDVYSDTFLKPQD